MRRALERAIGWAETFCQGRCRQSDDGKYVRAVLNSTLARRFELHAFSPACSKPLNITAMPIPQTDADAKRAYA